MYQFSELVPKLLKAIPLFQSPKHLSIEKC